MAFHHDLLPKNENFIPSPRPISKNILAPPPAQTKTVPIWTLGTQSLAYLQHVRTNSCYRTLRNVITILALLSFLALVLGAFGIILIGSQAGSLSTFTLIYAVVDVLFGAIIIVAARQAALLLIDLVDTQIEKNARQ